MNTCEVNTLFTLGLYSSFYRANVSEHFSSTTVQWVKTRPQHRETPCPTLNDECVGSLTSPADHNSEDARDGAYGLSSLSEKTRTSNHLQMSLQRQHILLSYFKTLSVGPVWARTRDLPHRSPALYQLS